jgi:hypothetical protein
MMSTKIGEERKKREKNLFSFVCAPETLRVQLQTLMDSSQFNNKQQR